MVLYSISFVLMLLACIIAGYQKRGWKWSTRLPMYITASAVLGRLTAWNHRITSGTESAFLIIATWEPGKEHKSAYRYYLVKE